MIPSALLILIASVVTLHYGGLYFGWYTLWWLDIPLHLLGGAFIGVLFLYIFRERFLVLRELSFFPLLVLGVGFVTWIGVLWEFYEFFADVFVLHTYRPLAYPGYVHFDTLLDLLNDMAGGTIAILLLWNAKR